MTTFYQKIINLFTAHGVDLKLGITASLVAAGIIFVFNFILKQTKKQFKKRRFFGRKTQNFILFTGQIYFEGSNHRYMASGDIKSVLTLALNIQSIFKLDKIPHRFSDEAVLNEDFRENVISVGGPKYNSVTKAIIEKYNRDIPDFPAKFVDNKISINAVDIKGNTFKEEFSFKRNNGYLTEDYGLLIRGINPFDDTRSSIIWTVAGSGSNGCIASADQMSAFIHGSKLRFRRLYRYLYSGSIGLVVVKANFIDGKYVSSVPIFFASYKPLRKFFSYKRFCWVFNFTKIN